MDPQSAECRDRLDFAALTDVGLRRSNNQDSHTVMIAASRTAWQQRGDLFMVADGMGAHAAGELASKLATDAVPLVYHKLATHTPPEAILAAVHEANAQIHSRGQASPDFKGMGTTSSVLVLLPQGAMVAQVGDSRTYRVRGSRIEQLTFDHSLVWEMRAAGQIKDDVPDFIPKNVITRSLGPGATVQVDLEGPFPIQVGDTFLLCSDGLSGQVKDDEIGMLLFSLTPAEAVRTLIDLANLRGGPDNITAIVARALGKQWTPSAAGDSTTPARTRPINPLVWVLLGVLALAGLGLMATPAWVAGAVSLGAAALVGVGAFFYRQSGGATLSLDGRRLGRGPYTAADCAPNAAFAGRLAEIAKQLSEAATHGGLKVDREQFGALVENGAKAVQAADFTQAVRQYAHAISFMVAELKRAGKK